MYVRVLGVMVLSLAMTCSASANLTLIATLNGANEAPTPVASPGTGFATAVHDAGTDSLAVNLSFSGLSSNTTNAALDCCATFSTSSGVALDFAGLGFPVGVTSGSFSHTFDLTDASTYTASYLLDSGGTAELAANRLLGSMQRLALPGLGIAYINIGTTMHPDGELRGNFRVLPEPATLVMLLCGVAAICTTRRRR